MPTGLDEQPSAESLDPEDWNVLRQAGHAILDDVFDHLTTVR